MINRMKQKFPAVALTALAMSIMLSACNENDDNGSTAAPTASLKTLTITPSLGKIRNARVILHDAATGGVLGERNTGLNGTASFTVPANVTSVIAEVRGVNNANDCGTPNPTATCYFDEATQSFQNMTNVQAIRTAAPFNSQIGVTPLTEAAVMRAETLTGHPASQGIPLNVINNANETVAGIFGFTPDALVRPPTLVGNPEELARLFQDVQNAANLYALRLAALVHNAGNVLESSNHPALQLAAALAADLADGDLDRQGPNNTPTANLYQIDDTSLENAIRAAWQNIASELQNNQTLGLPANVSQIISTLPVIIVPIPPLPVVTTPATVNAGLAGSYSLVYDLVHAGGPFTDNQAVQATVSGNTLTIAGVSLSNPVYRVINTVTNNSEVIWRDTSRHLDFALSNNVNGIFNEINVSDNSQFYQGLPLFLGQFTKAGSSNIGCGSQPTLTLADLASFSSQSPFMVDIKSGLEVVQHNVQLTLNANGDIALNGVTVHTSAVCQNAANNQNIGVVAKFHYGTSNTEEGHIDFFNPPFNGLVVSGVDFTAPSGVSRSIQTPPTTVAVDAITTLTLGGSAAGTLPIQFLDVVPDSSIAGRFVMSLSETQFSFNSRATITFDSNQLVHILLTKNNKTWQVSCIATPAACTNTVVFNPTAGEIALSNLVLTEVGGTATTTISTTVGNELPVLVPTGVLNVEGSQFNPQTLSLIFLPNNERSLTITGLVTGSFVPSGLEVLFIENNQTTTVNTAIYFSGNSSFSCISTGCAGVTLNTQNPALSFSNKALFNSPGTPTGSVTLNGSLTLQ